MMTIGLIVAAVLLMAALAPKMIGGIPTPQDAGMECQAKVTKTATFSGAWFDFGKASEPGGIGQMLAAVIDVSAGDRADGDETYTFHLEETEADADGVADDSKAADIGVTSAVTVATTVFTTGTYMAKGVRTKRFVRLVMTAAGTTPSITYQAWLNTLQQR